jgi:site-specific DNA-methyltransferase (adenine-specific)
MATKKEIVTYIENIEQKDPLIIQSDALQSLAKFPENSIDCVITSPPYWGHRQYSGGGIGLEKTYNEYIRNILLITEQLFRVLKPSGSFWLNMGDSYKSKRLQGIPWRIAIGLIDTQNWILRNSIIWNKHKGGLDSSKDKLRNIHENLFHFVKNEQGYFYDARQIRSKPRKAIIKNGSVISATGVSGIRYKRQIELSTALTGNEKQSAFIELEKILDRVRLQEISDFRMIIRGQQRTTHSNSEKVSGRAKELRQKGFYFLFYHPDGTLPGDVWDIIPEDTQKRKDHYAAYPEDLCKIPILATCPKKGIVLDPFCGTGTTLLVALKFNRKSIGIDLSTEYIEFSKSRINEFKHTNSGILQLFDRE